MAQAPGECDLAVVGAGILGLAVARELKRRRPELSAVVLERGQDVAGGQTGANSGVIHAGIYYVPGSLKARMCVTGAREMYEYCEERGIRHERCGKVIVARHQGELGRLDELERRGRENEVPGLRRLSASELTELEPHCRGIAALHSPATGIVDFADVARQVGRELESEGTPVVTGCGVRSVGQAPGRVTLQHERGETRARFAVFCAGAGSDRLAVAANASPDPRIVPFRGAYLYLRPERRELVRSLIYPVPDPSLPFLGCAPEPPYRRRGVAGPHRPAGPTSRARPDLARYVANGAPLVAHRSDRAATRAQPARPGRRRRGIRSRHRQE